MKPNPITGILGVQPRDDANVAAVVEHIEQLPGETEFDRIAKAQASAPHVRNRIEELENCLWSVTEQLILHEPHSPLIERVRLVLKNRLEIDDHPKPFVEDTNCDILPS